MRIEENYLLEKHNTFHLPVKTRWFMEYADEEELGRILHDEYFQECLSLHIGSGSNLLFINDFNGIILHSAIKGMTPVKETDDHVYLRVVPPNNGMMSLPMPYRTGGEVSRTCRLYPGRPEQPLSRISALTVQR